MESEALLWSQPDWTGHLDVYKEDARVWERRFFLLQGSFLFSFKNELDRSSPLGVIALEGCQVEEVPGDASRKHKLVVKLGPEYAAFGNHDQYFLSTSSSESLRSAIRRLEDASDPPDVLFRYLNKTWARAGELRHLLAKSPNDKTELESIKSPEAQSVKTELAKTYVEKEALLKKVDGQCAEADIKEKDLWKAQILRDILNSKGNAGDVLLKLQKETRLTRDAVELLQKRANYLQGQGLEDLSEDSRKSLHRKLRLALEAINERHARIRAEAPRYSFPVNSQIYYRGGHSKVSILRSITGLHRTMTLPSHFQRSVSPPPFLRPLSPATPKSPRSPPSPLSPQLPESKPSSPPSPPTDNSKTKEGKRFFNPLKLLPFHLKSFFPKSSKSDKHIKVSKAAESPPKSPVLSSRESLSHPHLTTFTTPLSSVPRTSVQSSPYPPHFSPQSLRGILPSHMKASVQQPSSPLVLQKLGPRTLSFHQQQAKPVSSIDSSRTSSTVSSPVFKLSPSSLRGKLPPSSKAKIHKPADELFPPFEFKVPTIPSKLPTPGFTSLSASSAATPRFLSPERQSSPSQKFLPTVTPFSSKLVSSPAAECPQTPSTSQTPPRLPPSSPQTPPSPSQTPPPQVPISGSSPSVRPSILAQPAVSARSPSSVTATSPPHSRALPPSPAAPIIPATSPRQVPAAPPVSLEAPRVSPPRSPILPPRPDAQVPPPPAFQVPSASVQPRPALQLCTASGQQPTPPPPPIAPPGPTSPSRAPPKAASPRAPTVQGLTLPTSPSTSTTLATGSIPAPQPTSPPSHKVSSPKSPVPQVGSLREARAPVRPLAALQVPGPQPKSLPPSKVSPPKSPPPQVGVPSRQPAPLAAVHVPDPQPAPPPSKVSPPKSPPPQVSEARTAPAPLAALQSPPPFKSSPPKSPPPSKVSPPKSSPSQVSEARAAPAPPAALQAPSPPPSKVSSSPPSKVSPPKSPPPQVSEARAAPAPPAALQAPSPPPSKASPPKSPPPSKVSPPKSQPPQVPEARAATRQPALATLHAPAPPKPPPPQAPQARVATPPPPAPPAALQPASPPKVSPQKSPPPQAPEARAPTRPPAPPAPLHAPDPQLASPSKVSPPKSPPSQAPEAQAPTRPPAPPTPAAPTVSGSQSTVTPPFRPSPPATASPPRPQWVPLTSAALQVPIVATSPPQALSVSAPRASARPSPSAAQVPLHAQASSPSASPPRTGSLLPARPPVAHSLSPPQAPPGVSSVSSRAQAPTASIPPPRTPTSPSPLRAPAPPPAPPPVPITSGSAVVNRPTFTPGSPPFRAPSQVFLPTMSGPQRPQPQPVSSHPPAAQAPQGPRAPPPLPQGPPRAPQEPPRAPMPVPPSQRLFVSPQGRPLPAAPPAISAAPLRPPPPLLQRPPFSSSPLQAPPPRPAFVAPQALGPTPSSDLYARPATFQRMLAPPGSRTPPPPPPLPPQRGQAPGPPPTPRVPGTGAMLRAPLAAGPVEQRLPPQQPSPFPVATPQQGGPPPFPAARPPQQTAPSPSSAGPSPGLSTFQARAAQGPPPPPPPPPPLPPPPRPFPSSLQRGPGPPQPSQQRAPGPPQPARPLAPSSRAVTPQPLSPDKATPRPEFRPPAPGEFNAARTPLRRTSSSPSLLPSATPGPYRPPPPPPPLPQWRPQALVTPQVMTHSQSQLRPGLAVDNRSMQLLDAVSFAALNLLMHIYNQGEAFVQKNQERAVVGTSSVKGSDVSSELNSGTDGRQPEQEKCDGMTQTREFESVRRDGATQTAGQGDQPRYPSPEASRRNQMAGPSAPPVYDYRREPPAPRRRPRYQQQRALYLGNPAGLRPLPAPKPRRRLDMFHILRPHIDRSYYTEDDDPYMRRRNRGMREEFYYPEEWESWSPVRRQVQQRVVLREEDDEVDLKQQQEKHKQDQNVQVLSPQSSARSVVSSRQTSTSSTESDDDNDNGGASTSLPEISIDLTCTYEFGFAGGGRRK